MNSMKIRQSAKQQYAENINNASGSGNNMVVLPPATLEKSSSNRNLLVGVVSQ